MAVTSAHVNDPIGREFDAAISAQQTVVNGLSPTGASHALYLIAYGKLQLLQSHAVSYYLSIGRINPATVLSSLS